MKCSQGGSNTGAETLRAAGEGEAVMPWVCWARPVRYGDWKIYRNDFTAHPGWMTVAWEYVHDDYDGAPDAGDNRCGHAASIDACIAEIQEWEEDHAA